MSTYRELLQSAEAYLVNYGVSDARLDAWYLFAYKFNISRADYFMKQFENISDADLDSYMELVKLRAAHKPLQYILGTQEFMGLEFKVDPNVLIPRQDTELLVEEVLKVSKRKDVLDLCTGSGCIIISLAKFGGLIKAVGADLSEGALRLAAHNAMKHEVEIQWVQGDLFENVTGDFDIIVSNPPYIPTKDIEDLMPEVRDNEPILALDGSEDGLLFYRRILNSIQKYLKIGGYVFFEIGYNQGEEVSHILEASGFGDIHIKKDYSGHDRIAQGMRVR